MKKSVWNSFIYVPFIKGGQLFSRLLLFHYYCPIQIRGSQLFSIFVVFWIKLSFIVFEGKSNVSQKSASFWALFFKITLSGPRALYTFSPLIQNAHSFRNITLVHLTVWHITKFIWKNRREGFQDLNSRKQAINIFAYFK